MIVVTERDPKVDEIIKICQSGLEPKDYLHMELEGRALGGPREPCGGDVCIDRGDLDRLTKRIEDAERERDASKAHAEELRISISRWLEVEMPNLHGLCEDCEQGHPDTCFACPDLLEALWVSDDMYRDIINDRKHPRQGTPERPLPKHGYAAVKAEGDEALAKLTRAEFIVKWTRDLFENSPGSPSAPMLDLLGAVHRYFDAKGESNAKPS